jgi:hypothetical protein
MKNRQPYMCVALVLRNLLTNGDKFEADHLKAICLFFEGCLDTNRDDTNAMRLLGNIALSINTVIKETISFKTNYENVCNLLKNMLLVSGLVLFRFYSTDAYAPFLKLLCTSCVQCRYDSQSTIKKSML